MHDPICGSHWYIPLEFTQVHTPSLVSRHSGVVLAFGSSFVPPPPLDVLQATSTTVAAAMGTNRIQCTVHLPGGDSA
jgi:hypothetical protein